MSGVGPFGSGLEVAHLAFVLRPDKERLNIPAVHKQSALPNKNKQQAPLGRTK
jgi:hypothetical protein